MVSELGCTEQSCVLSDVYKCKDCRTALTRTHFNTLWTGDADLRLYITTVQDG